MPDTVTLVADIFVGFSLVSLLILLIAMARVVGQPTNWELLATILEEARDLR